jgi:beta-dihydromenaquinone-9 omega-hydroxylase
MSLATAESTDHIASPTSTLTCPYSGATFTASAPSAASAVSAPPTVTESSAPAAAHQPSAPAAPIEREAPSEPAAESDPSDDAAAPPADIAVYYDPLSYAAYDHPYELYKILREKAPVYYNERRDLYVLSRYADVSAALKNHTQLVNALGNDMDGTHESYSGGNLISADQPVHTDLRAAVRRVFAARELLAKEDGIRSLARQLLDDLQAKGEGDFAVEVALPLAIGAAIRLVGMPAGDTPMLAEHLLRSMVRTVGEFGVPADAALSNGEAEEHLAEVFEHRISDIAAGADATTSDAITQILASVEKGKVSADDQVGLAHLVISAAIDAPAALATNLVALLDKFPAFQDYLAANPSRIPAFVEESLRFDTPGQNLCRQSTEEITIEGVTIPADSRVMVLLASANRDDRVFENPDFFDITRVFTPHTRIQSFGEGIHACMGAPLARIIGRVLVEELVTGPEIRVVGVPKRWAKQMVRGFENLPVKFITD